MLQKKRDRPAGSKCTKIKMEQKLAGKPSLVDEIHGSTLTSDTEAKVKFPKEYPNFTKRLMKSHVVKGFWLVTLCLSSFFKRLNYKAKYNKFPFVLLL